MASWGKVEFGQLKQFQKELEQIQQKELDVFLTSCTKELAARLLAQVIKRTPVGDYSGDAYISKSGKKKHRKYRTVRFNATGKDGEGKSVSFRAKVHKKGGTLRRGWTSKTHEEAAGKTGNADVSEYLDKLKIQRSGGDYRITIINPVEYASYVEFGHRTRNHKGWVPGQFMLTISEKNIREAAPGILEKKLKKWLEETLG